MQILDLVRDLVGCHAPDIEWIAQESVRHIPPSKVVTCSRDTAGMHTPLVEVRQYGHQLALVNFESASPNESPERGLPGYAGSSATEPTASIADGYDGAVRGDNFDRMTSLISSARALGTIERIAVSVPAAVMVTLPDTRPCLL